MKIGIITDVHANLPALEKAIEFFKSEKCDLVIHVGDLVGIGPFPKECLELALAQNHFEFIMGNHDYWYAYGLPDPIPSWMSIDEVAHQNWTHSQLGSVLKNKVKDWPFLIQKTIQGIKFSFVHYGLNRNQNWFSRIIKNPSGRDLDLLFEELKSDIIIYGHTHEFVDLQGLSRYVNVGSAGCANEAKLRCGIIDIFDKKYAINFFALPYSDKELFKEFDKRKVPARSFIKKVFMPR